MLKARRISQDFAINGSLDDSLWTAAEPACLDQQSLDGKVRPEIATSVRALWSAQFLYLAWDCPYNKLTVFPLQTTRERADLRRDGERLWERDIIEVFLGADWVNPNRYTEFEVAPTNERLDVMVNLPTKDFAWNSGFESAVKVDKKAGTWTCEMRIPLKSIAEDLPAAGTPWRMNLFRCDRANQASLAWRPVLRGS